MQSFGWPPYAWTRLKWLELRVRAVIRHQSQYAVSNGRYLSSLVRAQTACNFPHSSAIGRDGELRDRDHARRSARTTRYFLHSHTMELGSRIDANHRKRERWHEHARVRASHFDISCDNRAAVFPGAASRRCPGLPMTLNLFRQLHARHGKSPWGASYPQWRNREGNLSSNVNWGNRD